MDTSTPPNNANGADAAKPRTKRPTSARRSSASSRTASTRARRTSASSRGKARASTAAARNPAERAGDYAERAILIPVGAALIARDRLVSGVEDAISTYSSSSKIEAQLRRFERRGGTARRRLEREVRKTRTRLERGVRQRRRDIDRRSHRFRKEFSSQVEQAQEQFEKTQSWLGDTLKSRNDDSHARAGRAQERVLSEA
jgi:hypothetical protein